MKIFLKNLKKEKDKMISLYHIIRSIHSIVFFIFLNEHVYQLCKISSLHAIICENNSSISILEKSVVSTLI